MTEEIGNVFYTILFSFLSQAILPCARKYELMKYLDTEKKKSV